MSPEVLASENALQVMQTKKAKSEAEKADWENKKSRINYYRETLKNVDPEKFGPEDYENWQEYMKKEGIPIAAPPLDVFFQKVENWKGDPKKHPTAFNSKMFNAWKLNSISTADEVAKGGLGGHGLKPYTVYVPKVDAEGNKTGEYGTIVHFVKGDEAFDPTTIYGKDATVEKPAAEKSFKVGDLRNFEKDGEKIYEEYDGTKWVKKSSGPRWNPKDSKPEYTPGQALKRMTALMSAKVKLQSGNPIDALVLAQFPEYQGLMASADPEARKTAIAAIDEEMAHVSKFAPKKEGRTAPPADTKAKADLTERATALLKDKGYPITQANIDHVVKQLGKK